MSGECFSNGGFPDTSRSFYQEGGIAVAFPFPFEHPLINLAFEYPVPHILSMNFLQYYQICRKQQNVLGGFCRKQQNVLGGFCRKQQNVYCFGAGAINAGDAMAEIHIVRLFCRIDKIFCRYDNFLFRLQNFLPNPQVGLTFSDLG